MKRVIRVKRLTFSERRILEGPQNNILLRRYTGEYEQTHVGNSHNSINQIKPTQNL